MLAKQPNLYMGQHFADPREAASSAFSSHALFDGSQIEE